MQLSVLLAKVIVPAALAIVIKLPVEGFPFHKAPRVALTVFPAQPPKAGIIQVPLTVPLDRVIVESEIPLIVPPIYCISHPVPFASIWKKLALEQFPVYVPVIVTVSPCSQFALEPGAQFAVIEALVKLHAATQAETW